MFAFNGRASSNYLEKRSIKCEVKVCSTFGLRKSSRNVQVLELENSSFFGTAPGHYQLVDWPRKDTVAVGTPEICGCERPTKGNDAIDRFGGVLKINQVAIMGHYFKLSASLRSLRSDDVTPKITAETQRTQRR